MSSRSLDRRFWGLALVVALVAAPAAADRETRTRRERLAFGSGADRALRVHNLNGSVRARGYDGEQVQLDVRETVRGRSSRDLEEVRAAYPLNLEVAGSEIEVWVGPCRPRERDCRRWVDLPRDVEIEYDLELLVPRDVEVTLRTVNGGEVTLHDHRGDFRVGNVNGPVEVLDVDGSGDATTVNGDVTVRFVSAPVRDCRFDTVNGEIEAAFPADLAARLEFDTMNGEVFTDFDYTLAPSRETTRHRERGRQVLRHRLKAGVQVASGGPTLSFHNLNGDILVRQRDR